MEVRGLQERLARGEPTVVLDIRPAEQRRAWSIPGSVWVDAFAAVRRGDFGVLDGLELPRGVPVVAVCAAGFTSQLAAEHLRGKGLRAESLEGGMRAWGHAWNLAEATLRDGSRVLQLRRTGRGCLSYLVASAGEALVVDAVVEPEVYEEHAANLGLRIVGALDTHLHADHLSRSHRLARRLGIPYYASGRARLTFPHQPLHEGDAVEAGDTALEVLATPGHTWDSSTFRLRGGAVLTGDTLFVDGVGRPDLGAGGEEVRDRAWALHASLQRLLALPPETRVLAAHASGPLPFDHVAWDAALGQVRERVDLLVLDGAAFVEAILARTPDVPETYHRIVALNRAGRWPEEERDDLEAGANQCALG